METYFNIQYEFDREQVHTTIEQRLNLRGGDYVCVADGVVLNNVNRNTDYLQVVNGGLFSICDSSYVPLYIKWIYGKRYEQYCGSHIFMDIIQSRRYRMIFMGASQPTLDGLKENLKKWNPDVVAMTFYELPFKHVEEFDYPAIAKMIEVDGADIIWVALGAPKQEIFMSKLKPHLHRGVMIAVGAVFKFFCGTEVKRAPDWMIKARLEFLYRIFSEPGKQLKRCTWIVITLPGLLFAEWKRKQNKMNKKIDKSTIL